MTTNSVYTNWKLHLIEVYVFVDLVLSAPLLRHTRRATKEQLPLRQCNISLSKLTVDQPDNVTTQRKKTRNEYMLLFQCFCWKRSSTGFNAKTSTLLNWAFHEHSTSYLSKRQRPELECVKSYHGKQISFAAGQPITTMWRKNNWIYKCTFQVDKVYRRSGLCEMGNIFNLRAFNTRI